MKIIPLTEAKARLSHYAALCQDEPIIVTVNGVPAFQLVPVDADGDLINELLQHHPSFRSDMERRLRETPIPWNTGNANTDDAG
ncbi:MAG: type II toxin-antitoxin system Phd/YefM family antitoxin [Chloroflexales bacterium]|jgi:prevent-host-death family protein|nr:type II toxin-antitoxin system Phd/YefM family antitoxin [Chloroflexales bacterium]